MNISIRLLEFTDYQDIIDLIKNELGYARLTKNTILNQLDAIYRNKIT